MTEREKQLAGDWFKILDPELCQLRRKSNELTFQLNQLANSQKEERQAIYKKLFGSCGENVNIKPTFECDYGCNIFLGDRVFINSNCVFTDGGRIEIEDDTLIGPQVGLYTINHPTDAQMRKSGIERSATIHIGKNCWIGGHVTINPGVTLGDNVIVASGAVVTKSFESNVMIAGVPAKIIKKL